MLQTAQRSSSGQFPRAQATPHPVPWSLVTRTQQPAPVALVWIQRSILPYISYIMSCINILSPGHHSQSSSRLEVLSYEHMSFSIVYSV